MEEAQRRHESYAVRIGRRAATRSGVSFAVYAGTKVYAKLQKPRNGERPARRGGPTGPSNVEACDPGPRGLQSGISLFDTVYTFPDRTRSTERSRKITLPVPAGRCAHRHAHPCASPHQAVRNGTRRSRG